MTTRMIRHEQDVWDFFSADSRAQCKRHVYKYTDCGAWIAFRPDGVLLGSIVEGSDAEVSTDPLLYPFTSEELQQTINYIEDEAYCLWHEANDPDDEEAGV